MTASERKRLKQAQLVAQGRCRTCGTAPLATKTRCARCAEALRNAWSAKYKAKRVPDPRLAAIRAAEEQITMVRLTPRLRQINDIHGQFSRTIIHEQLAHLAFRDSLIRRARDILGLDPDQFRDEGGSWKFYV